MSAAAVLEAVLETATPLAEKVSVEPVRVRKEPTRKRLDPLINPWPDLTRAPNALVERNAVQGRNGFRTVALYPIVPGRAWVPDTRRDRTAEVEAIKDRDRALSRARLGLSDECPVGGDLTVYGYEGRDHWFRFDPHQFWGTPRHPAGELLSTSKKAAAQ
jgi:hypothetical protein